jgi:hypothetical protein
MKTTSRYLFLSLILMIFGSSCKDKMLEDFESPKADPVTISAGNVKGIKKDNEKVTFQVGIALSSPAKKAFQVSLTLNPDTITTLIANNTLTNTVLLPSATYKVPNVTNVSYGVDSAFFEVQVNNTVLEKYYGKNVALAVSLIDPTKGNLTDASKNTTIIVLNTKDVIVENEIHYISITDGEAGVLDVKKGQNYKVTSAGVSITLNLALAGIPGRPFTVKARTNQDTIPGLVSSGKLPANTKALAEGKYLLDTVISIAGNKSLGTVELSIPWGVMDENLQNPVAISISLVSASLHLISPTNSNIIVLVDPSVSQDNNSYIDGKGTGLKAEYFKGTQTINEGGRVPDLVRIDEKIDFGGWQPFPNADDNWSSRWTGEFFAPVRGEYTFYQTRWDDGARLFINGVTIVNDFTAEWDKPSRFGKIFLERGQRYPIEVHHRENVGGQQAHLEFEVPSAGIDRQIVPKSLLFPAP